MTSRLGITPAVHGIAHEKGKNYSEFLRTAADPMADLLRSPYV
jgi:hypothetical protein